MLKFCYAPATRAAHNRLLFFSFFAVGVYSTKEANNAGLKQSIFLDVYVINKPTSSSDRDILTIFSNFILISINLIFSGIFRQMAHTANIRVIGSRLVGAVSTRTRPFGIRDRLFKGR